MIKIIFDFKKGYRLSFFVMGKIKSFLSVAFIALLQLHSLNCGSTRRENS